jgi:uncharacterized protein
MTSDKQSQAARPRARPLPGRRIPAALPMARLAARTAPAGARAISEAPRTAPDALPARMRSLLVTYRRDGTPVPTPAWAAGASGRLYVRSERSSGKVKRLRHDPRMLVAACTTRGKPRGAPFEATARVLPVESELIAERALAKSFGPVRALFEWSMDVLRIDMCYLEITPQTWESNASQAAAAADTGVGVRTR